MEYTTLGDTGMEVSRICLGCMSFGSSDWRPWVLDEDEATSIIERAIDLGVNVFDTANMYSEGESERVLRDALEGYREQSVVANEVLLPDGGGQPPLRRTLAEAIEQELDNSLERLGVDTIDRYQTHRWNADTPIEKTLAALDDAVRRGMVRNVGASSMWTYQFADSLGSSERLGLERFVSMQNHYNLVYREEEREMLPLCEQENVGRHPVVAARPRLPSRPHEEIDATRRGESEEHMYRHPYREGGGQEINERVAELAAEKDVTMAQIALAWLFHQDVVTVPIVGTTSVEHLEQAVEALDISLSSSDQDYLEEPYEPVQVSGHD